MKTRFIFSITLIILINSCTNDVKKEIEEKTRMIEFIKNELFNDSIFIKSPLPLIIEQTDSVYNYYYRLIDTLQDLKQAVFINDYSKKFIDIDSIIDLNNETIRNIEAYDTREAIRIKILENKLTLFKRVKYFWDNQNEYNVFKVIRVNPSVKVNDLKNIIIFVPDGYKIITCSDSGYFFGINNFLSISEKVNRIENDSIFFKIHNEGFEKQYIIKFDIY